MITKLKFTILALALSITAAFSQAPNMINYQGLAANAAGTPLANQSIRVRLKIHNATAAGTIQYSEVRTLTTDASGLFNIQIGSAGAVSTTGSWAGITWDNGAKFLQVEMDPTGGTTYTNMGTQQLVSVPYAQFAKQAGSLSSSATVNPSQINAAGATSGQVLQYNGSSWLPATIQQGGSFALPQLLSDPNLVSMAITNTSATGGSAFYGKTTTNSATANGVLGESSAANGNGIHGRAVGITANGVFGENTTGYGVKGLTTTSSTSGAAIYGENNGTQGNGVLGVANFATGTGVQGVSTDGIGVKGYSNINAAVSGSTISGTALKGFSSSGYGLDVSGKVKIAGGNTSPGAGKVLTSDASGNATWQSVPKVAFRASSGMTSFPVGTTKNNFSTVEYNIGNGFNVTTDVFTVPVAGVYNFSGLVEIFLSSSVYNLQDPDIYLKLVRNGVVSYISSVEGYVKNLGSSGSSASLQFNTSAQLQVGDQLSVEINQFNSNNLTATTAVNSSSKTYFCGNLIFAN